MLRGILISLLASLFIWLYVLFFHATETASVARIFSAIECCLLPFVALALIMFKQKQALVEHLKRIKIDRSFALSYIICGALMGYQMWLFYGHPIMVAP